MFIIGWPYFSMLKRRDTQLTAYGKKSSKVKWIKTKIYKQKSFSLGKPHCIVAEVYKKHKRKRSEFICLSRNHFELAYVQVYFAVSLYFFCNNGGSKYNYSMVENKVTLVDILIRSCCRAFLHSCDHVLLHLGMVETNLLLIRTILMSTAWSSG